MSKILTVPHYQQLADGYCLPACVQMVLAYWGINREQTDLAKELKMVPQAGTPGSRLKLLSSPDLDVVYQSGNLSDLNDALSAGIPPIVLVFTGELPYWKKAAAHAVVLLGIVEDSVILNDPGIVRAESRVPVGDFHLAWDEMANLYSLLKKK